MVWKMAVLFSSIYFQTSQLTSLTNLLLTFDVDGENNSICLHYRPLAQINKLSKSLKYSKINIWQMRHKFSLLCWCWVPLKDGENCGKGQHGQQCVHSSHCQSEAFPGIHPHGKMKNVIFDERVIETRGDVWENEKCCGNMSRRWVFPQFFQVLHNFQESFYKSIETQRKCFLFLLENSPRKITKNKEHLIALFIIKMYVVYPVQFACHKLLHHLCVSIDL